jgi:hypothetical protein
MHDRAPTVSYRPNPSLLADGGLSLLGQGTFGWMLTDATKR